MTLPIHQNKPPRNAVNPHLGGLDGSQGYVERHGGLPSDGGTNGTNGTAGEEPAGGEHLGPSRDRIVALLLSGATVLSERNRHEFHGSEHNRPSIQRCDRRNTAIIADVDDVTKNFGENDAKHTPSQAGRALPGSDRGPTAAVFDPYQDFQRPAATPGSASGVAARDRHPRSAAAPGQRSALTDTAQQFRIFRNHYLCDACPNEWSDEMMVVGPSWCPCCEREAEPYDSEALLEPAEEDAEP